MDYSIGEFASLMQVTVKTLHHYDKIGLLPPASVDRFTGYRRYSVNQLETVSRIYRYRELGLSLPKIRNLLASPAGSAESREILDEHRIELAFKISRDQQTYQELSRMLGTNASPEDEVARRQIVADCIILPPPAVERHHLHLALPRRLAALSVNIPGLSGTSIAKGRRRLGARCGDLPPEIRWGKESWIWSETPDNDAEGRHRLNLGMVWEEETLPEGFSEVLLPETDAEFQATNLGWSANANWKQNIAHLHHEMFEAGFVPVGPTYFTPFESEASDSITAFQGGISFSNAGLEATKIETFADDESDVETFYEDRSPFGHLGIGWGW